jgi:hypothetical protein
VKKKITKKMEFGVKMKKKKQRQRGEKHGEDILNKIILFSVF